MTNYKEILKSFTKEDFENKKVNLHIHTFYSDGLAKPEDIITQAKEKGYKKIAICDHNTLKAYTETDILKNDIIIPAIEFDVWCGYVFMHLLAYGIDVNNEELQSFCAKTKKETEADYIRIFSGRNIKKLIQAIHNAGGIAVLAHPANCWALSMNRFIKKLMSYGLDGLEVYYPYKRHRGIIKFRTAHHIEKLADKYNLIKTGGTDLHGKELI
ncbi:PHP domain-containing protein [bacterium]|nr:PHP domain-containing protein [bacterium]